MIGITRYHISDGNHPSVEYVTYEDHLARIASLEDRLASITQARLEWAMTCPCECADCDVFYDRIREFTNTTLETKGVKNG